MPVILPGKHEQDWIDPGLRMEKSGQLLLPLKEKHLYAHRISPKITAPGTDPLDPSVIEEAHNQSPGFLF